ncbi:MAG TPA: hypothetical protein VGW39_03180 [Chthoniobacterales bacterium]|nr:hypothetical protein [Chthoniobacterales bacterium]
MSRELPISLGSARKATNWLMTNFGGSIRSATDGTPFNSALLCGIACQETAYFWLPLLTKAGSTITPDEVVARCVLDASGDAPNAPRSAFPKNTAAFRAKYDRAFCDMLVDEANATRALRGFSPKEWIYKGYGIFQYDLQFVVEDEDYFRFKQWHDFELCLKRVMKELKTIFARNGGNLWEAVRAYNGGGQSARDYRDNVKQFAAAAQEEIDSMAAPRTRGRARAAAAPAKARRPQPGDVLLMTRFMRGGKARTRGGEKPASRPQLSRADLAAKLAPFGLDRTKHPLIVVGIRGYYRDTMGAPGVNDRGIYDDAIFIDAGENFVAFNGNTDPSKFRPGEGFSEATKGIASLDPGAWLVHRFDKHKGEYLALCQRAGKVTVTRDGKKENYKDTGEFGINIHRGSFNGTSSLGCQTIHPDQWEGFIGLAVDLARRFHGEKWKQVVIPYVLMENA